MWVDRCGRGGKCEWKLREGEGRTGFSVYGLARMGRQLRGCSTSGVYQIMSVYGKFVCNAEELMKC